MSALKEKFTYILHIFIYNLHIYTYVGMNIICAFWDVVFQKPGTGVEYTETKCQENGN